jgi:uncharacterized membrane protein
MRLAISGILAVVGIILADDSAMAQAMDQAAHTLPWWAWVMLLLVMTFALGVISVLGGIGMRRAVRPYCKRPSSIWISCAAPVL